MNVPENLKYAESHEWILVEDNIATIGITDHAQAELTDVVYVDLPKTGDQLSAGQAAAVVESVKAASDIYSPVDGVVVEVNDVLSSEPALVNTSPYESGWLFKVRLDNPSQLDDLLSPVAYLNQIS